MPQVPIPFQDDVLILTGYCVGTCEDAAPSVVAWELYDPCKVVACEEGSFANRGYHLNSLVMPMWTKAENDHKCRQFARDLSNMFKKEIDAHGVQSSEGIEGGASVRGAYPPLKLRRASLETLSLTLANCIFLYF